MQRLARFGGDHGQVRPPHVGTDKTQARNHRLPQGCQAPAQGGLGAPLAHPQQTAAMAVDLVNDGQEIVGPLAPAPMNLVHADGLDAFEFAVGQTPLHKPLHRAIDAFPTGVEGPRRLPPRQPPRPAGKKAHHGDGHWPLALTPGNMLNHHAVFRAVDPPGGIAKPRRDAPQRHKEPGALLQPVIARRGLEAAGAFGRDGRMRLDGDFDATGLAIPMALQADVVVNESGKTLNRVQNGLNLQLNSWSPFRVLALFLQLAPYSNFRGSAICFYRPGRRRAVSGRGRRAAAASAELQFAPPPVATRNGLARPHPKARPRRPNTTQTVKTRTLENQKCHQNHPQKVLQTQDYKWQ